LFFYPYITSARYNNVWIETIGDSAVTGLKLTKVSEEIKKQKEVEKIEKLKQDFEDAVGFRKVYVMMCKAKKPIIGHNMFLDVAHTQERFNSWLPKTPEEFKKELNASFPK
jgi:poly(A)-specific ribonuclease